MQYYQTQYECVFGKKHHHMPPVPTGILHKDVQKVGLLENKSIVFALTLKAHTQIEERVVHTRWLNDFEKQLVILALVAIVGLFAVRDVISVKQLREWLQSNITRLL